MKRLPVVQSPSLEQQQLRVREARAGDEARRLLSEATAHLELALKITGASRKLGARAASELDRAFERLDAYIDHLIDAAELPVSCAAGCSACCTEAPPVHAIEGLRMARALLARPDGRARVQRIVEQAREFQALLLRRLRDAGVNATQAQTRTAVYREAQNEWRRLGRACPVLGADGRCSEYRARPLACRVYVNVDDPARCAPTHPGFATLQRPNLWSTEESSVFEQTLARLGELVGLPPVPNLQWAVARFHSMAKPG